MALITGESGVLAFENVSGLAMIEVLDVPLHQRKVFAIVLRVAAGTLLTGTRWDVVCSMQAVASRKSGRDFGVTLQALQRRLPAKLMATGTISRSVE